MSSARCFRRRAIFCAFIVFAAAPAAADGALRLRSDGRIYELGGHLAVLRDVGSRLGIEDVLRLDSRFTMMEENEPTFGFIPDVFWVRIVVRNEAPDLSWLIDHSYPPMDRIRVWEVIDGAVTAEMESGDNVPLARRPEVGRTYRFPIDPPIGAVAVYYLRFQTESSMVLALRLWERKAFLRAESTEQLLIGMYFGLMAVMVFYNLFIFVSSRERSYLYYILFVASHAFFQASMLGVATVYLWAAGTWWTDHALVIFASLAVAFSALFTREFLQARTWAPRLSLLVDLCLAVAVITLVLSFVVPYSVSIVMTNTILVVFSVIFIFVAVVVLRRGYMPARFYLIAWSMLLVAVFVLALKNFGVVPNNTVTANVLQIGSVFEVVFLSLAITDRINSLQRGKFEAEQELLLSRQQMLDATEERLYNDSLTGLPNRRKLLADVPGLRHPHLFLVNVDHFRQINDFHGNKMGDRVLLELRDRIRAVSDPVGAALYKLHADEYAVVHDRAMSEQECLDYGRRIYAAGQSEPYTIDGNDIRLDVSVGISLTEGPLLEQADMALTEARATHTSVRVYDPSMMTRKQYEDNLRWVAVLREALRTDAVVPYFQPIVNNRNGAVEKYESLIRLRGGDGGMVSPGKFLAIAKASRLYPALSRRMIEKSFEAFGESRTAFSINISIEDILQNETLDLIRTMLDRYGVRGGVVFEILESEGIHRYDIASRFIDEMKGRGCDIAIDDFGSGYSNFGHILRLKVDYLKVDGALIRNLHEDPQAYTIVETIQRFAANLGIKTVAEYVHCEEVHRAVTNLGMDYSQGYYLGEPSPGLERSRRGQPKT